MKETCSCDGRATATPKARQAVLDAEDRWALRCPGCGRLDNALPFTGGVLILAGHAAAPGRDTGRGRIPA